MIGRLQSGRRSTTELTASATSSTKLGPVPDPLGGVKTLASAAGESAPWPSAPVTTPSPGTTPRMPIGASLLKLSGVAYAPSAAGRSALGLSGATMCDDPPGPAYAGLLPGPAGA